MDKQEGLITFSYYKGSIEAVEAIRYSLQKITEHTGKDSFHLYELEAYLNRCQEVHERGIERVKQKCTSL